jgi:hypothetical protein
MRSWRYSGAWREYLSEAPLLHGIDKYLVKVALRCFNQLLLEEINDLFDVLAGGQAEQDDYRLPSDFDIGAVEHLKHLDNQ